VRILGIKPGHDGAFALCEDGKLIYSIEGEKNSFARFCSITPSALVEAAMQTRDIPECIAFGGWQHGSPSAGKRVGIGYFGVSEHDRRISEISFFGRKTRLFEGTHEGSHVWAAYGMSPFADTYPCYALVWEGQIGRFYRLDEGGKITAYPQVLAQPGSMYQFIFALAEPTRIECAIEPRPPEDAGKIMALAAFADHRPRDPDEQAFVDWLLSRSNIIGTLKGSLTSSPFYNIGVTSQRFKQLARHVSDALFDRFLGWARSNLEPGLPLAIGGGCGLNCEWNTEWVRSGIFSHVFVPPCPNDAGSAIGSAVQAQVALTGRAAVQWNVYCGSIQRHHDERLRSIGCDSCEIDLDAVVADLCEGHIVAVMRGRCEIGPRALGNRSLLADPRHRLMLDRLNKIKQRESYRPIAPVCTVEAAPVFFDMPCEDKYMLYLSRVRDDRIPAVTHVDGSARVQVVRESDHPFLWTLLSRFGQRTGVPVLCNTSLNFKGKGFLDDADDLLRFCRETGVRRAVCEDRYIRL
jgi:hydroxymethyl cephem carbamoyltransferase